MHHLQTKFRKRKKIHDKKLFIKPFKNILKVKLIHKIDYLK